MFENCTNENTPWLSLKGITCQCKILDVYDADTVTIVLPFKNELFRIKCRLLGIDSAEKRTKNLHEKKVALEATEWLSNLIKDKVVWVKCGNWGKYGGRMLGTLYMSEDEMEKGHSINKKIIEKGFAYPYNGKKRKIKFEEWYNKINTVK
jgi:endonuclease YncB( thermonuclease family)